MWTQHIYTVHHMSLVDTAHTHVPVSGSEIIIQERMSGPLGDPPDKIQWMVMLLWIKLRKYPLDMSIIGKM